MFHEKSCWKPYRVPGNTTSTVKGLFHLTPQTKIADFQHDDSSGAIRLKGGKLCELEIQNNQASVTICESLLWSLYIPIQNKITSKEYWKEGGLQVN